ncbi:hypothetical protein M3Y97_00840600 [Aphelenchoides bicaudatus]|nr:hypothetical protein M3Y97_00840600 [Aphelenchoides bicaudatus]
MNSQNALIAETNQLVKQYISSYKYYQSLAINELDEHFEKDFRIQIDRIITGIVGYIEHYEIENLIAIWEFFNTKLFNNLDEHENRTANKLEADIFKLYLANCVQNKQLQRCTDFYTKMGPMITKNPQWTDAWFCLPYLPEPTKDDKFKNYFSKQWHELLLVSLHNFIACRIDRLCKPPLLDGTLNRRQLIQKTLPVCAQITS